MKKTVSILFVAFVAMSFFSCGNKSAEAEARIDSLETALQQRDADYQQLDEFLSVISAGLDSISRQETEIFNPSKESPIPTRDQIKQDLTRFQQTLQSQRERIAQLERKLNASTGEGKKMKAIILSLQTQLAEKEKEIAALQEEIDDKNITIQDLGKRMSAMSHRINVQNETIASQQAMNEQLDGKLNQGFVMIATERALKDAGLLTSGFLKKGKIDYSKIDKDQFATVDIRNTNHIDIHGKNPKIMTSHPEDSYALVEGGTKSVLNIIDVNRFWSVSKYLIVKIK